MKILDPITGETIDTDTWDQTNLSIISERKMREAQNRMLSRGLPRSVPMVDQEFDEEIFRHVPVVFAGDPGDEN